MIVEALSDDRRIGRSGHTPRGWQESPDPALDACWYHRGPPDESLEVLENILRQTKWGNVAVWEEGGQGSDPKRPARRTDELIVRLKEAVAAHLFSEPSTPLFRGWIKSWFSSVQDLCKQSHMQMPRQQPSSPLDRAYDELDILLVRRHVSGPTSELEKQIEAAWARLREIQEVVCCQVERRLEKSLALPPHELKRLTEEAQALLDEEQ